MLARTKGKLGRIQRVISLRDSKHRPLALIDVHWDPNASRAVLDVGDYECDVPADTDFKCLRVPGMEMLYLDHLEPRYCYAPGKIIV